MKRTMKKGFTLVEIMIVVAIIAILAAVAIPNFVKYRRNSQASACVSNLKQIQGAIEQARMAGKTDYADADLFGEKGYIKNAAKPECPAGGTYTYLSLDDTSDPTCSIGKTLDGDDKSSWHILDKGGE